MPIFLLSSHKHIIYLLKLLNIINVNKTAHVLIFEKIPSVKYLGVIKILYNSTGRTFSYNVRQQRIQISQPSPNLTIMNIQLFFLTYPTNHYFSQIISDCKILRPRFFPRYNILGLRRCRSRSNPSSPLGGKENMISAIPLLSP